jgi:hypothetical protein
VSEERRLKQTRTLVQGLALWRHLRFNVHVSFDGFNWRKDMWIGLGLEFLRIWFQWSIAVLDHPTTEIISYVVPVFLVLIGDASWRIMRATVGVYREREQVTFRDAANTLLVLFAGWFFVGGICLLARWMSIPHLEILFGEDSRCAYLSDSQKYDAGCRAFRLTLSQMEGLPTPNTSVFFERITTENSSDAAADIESWHLDVFLPSGDRLLGEAHTHLSLGTTFVNPGDGKKYYYPIQDSIFSKTRERKVSKGNPVNGWAEFYIPNTLRTSVVAPGTILRVVAIDTQGRVYSADDRVGTFMFDAWPHVPN